MIYSTKDLLKLRPKIVKSSEVTVEEQLNTVNWMDLVSGTLRATEPSAEFAAVIIDRIRQRIEEALERESLSKTALLGQIAQVEKTIKHVGEISQRKERLLEQEHDERSRILHRLEEEELDLSRIRLQARMWRAPIILVPFGILVAAFSFGAFGVINIHGQNFDIHKLVSNKVAELRQDIVEQSSDALKKIDQAAQTKLAEVEALPVDKIVGKEIELRVGSLVDNENVKKRIDDRVQLWEKAFSEHQLEKVKERADSANTLLNGVAARLNGVAARIDQLELRLRPLETGFEVIRAADPNEFKYVFALANRARWMTPMLVGAMAVTLGLIIGLAFTWLRRRNRG